MMDERLPAEEFTPPLITTRSKNLLTIALEEIADSRIGYSQKE